MKSSPTPTLIHRHLPLWIFLLPVMSINLAYVAASALNHIPACIPYLHGCTSISSAGRIIPEKAIFLLGMIPVAILSMMFWLAANNWLVQRQHQADHRLTALALSGAVASFFLLIYVTTLGIPGDFYRLTRKFAVLLYFGGTFISQLLLIQQLFLSEQEKVLKLAKTLKWFAVLLLLSGIGIIPISLIDEPIRQKQLENIVEWNFALLLHVYYLLIYPLWRLRGPSAHTTASQE